MSERQVTVSSLAAMKQAGEKFAALTWYDAAFTRVLEAAGVAVLLVGDSLGNVLQGRGATVRVRVSDIVYHTACVARARRHALLIADMPFLSYRSAAHALDTAVALMQDGGAQMVKLEGGAAQFETVRRLSEQGVPVCGHLGLLPQSVHKLGGYRVQGRDAASARQIGHDALGLQQAGAELLVLECVPAALAAEIARSVRIPVIGIGAGAACDGQVLVLHDLLGVTPAEGEPPRFVKNFLVGRDSIADAVRAYVDEVKAGVFPTAEQAFS